jgi:hypothetical protein
MSLIDNRPLLLTDIAKRWSKDACAGSADRIYSDLIAALWRGEFSEGAVLVDPRRLLDSLFPEGHAENVAREPDQTMTPAYLVECLMDAPEFHPEGSLGQALNDV